MLISQAEVRYRAFKRTPDFDSEWAACTSSQTYTYTHNIGALPEFALVEVAENSDGSGWRVPTMSASNYSSDWWRQTAIVRMTDTTVALRTGSRLVRFHDETGADISVNTGYCRVRLFEWTPDYDSGWTATSITAGDRDKWFKHGLGQEPSLVMLYVAENADGSGWLLPAMNSYHYAYTDGVGIYRVTDQWAVIKGSESVVAHFKDQNGTLQSPTSGYVRFMAWK